MDSIKTEIEKFIKERKNKTDVAYALSHRIIQEMIFEEPEEWIPKLELDGALYIYQLYYNTMNAFYDNVDIKESEFASYKADNDGIRLYMIALPKAKKFGDVAYITVALDAYYKQLYYFILELGIDEKYHLLSQHEDYKDLGCVDERTDMEKLIFSYLLE